MCTIFIVEKLYNMHDNFCIKICWVYFRLTQKHLCGIFYPSWKFVSKIFENYVVSSETTVKVLCAMKYFITQIKTWAICVRDSLINKWVNIDYLNALDYTAKGF